MGGKKIENLFDITDHRVKVNSHIPVKELNVFSPLPGHKYLVVRKKKGICLILQSTELKKIQTYQ